MTSTEPNDPRSPRSGHYTTPPQRIEEWGRFSQAIRDRGYEPISVGNVGALGNYYDPQHGGEFFVRYFPTLTAGHMNGRGILKAPSVDAMLAAIAALPDPPEMDEWTRLALLHGPQPAAYRSDDSDSYEVL